jgi:hypothetical protein
MKKTLLLLIIIFLNYSCSSTRVSTFLTATFLNKNVYETKANLPVKKVSYDGRVVTDARTYTIIPNDISPVIKTATTVTEGSVPKKESSYVKTVTVVSTMPKTYITTTKDSVSIEKKSTGTVVTSTIKYSDEIVDKTNNSIRYKVLSEDGSFTYLKVLPGCAFGQVPQDTLIVYREDADAEVSKYVFQAENKNFTPNTHYLASSALVGKLITLPMRVRKEYWDGGNTAVEGTLALAYGFGWKYKIGRNPYQSWFLSTILYGAGVSGQKYFSLTGTDPVTNKALLSEKRDEIAITYLSFGVAVEYDKFNLGLFAGRDKMFGNSSNWAYQCRWWWGVGIGYDLFK